MNYYELTDKNWFELKKDRAIEKFNIPVIHQVSVQELEDILVTAFESDVMNGWAMLDNNTEEWNNKPKDMPIACFALELLLWGKEIVFCDCEDESEKWSLDINKLLTGIAKNIQERPEDCDLEQMDCITADCIIQYALFGDIIYG